jgi:hypothetical protein
VRLRERVTWLERHVDSLAAQRSGSAVQAKQYRDLDRRVAALEISRQSFLCPCCGCDSGRPKCAYCLAHCSTVIHEPPRSAEYLHKPRPSSSSSVCQCCGWDAAGFVTCSYCVSRCTPGSHTRRPTTDGPVPVCGRCGSSFVLGLSDAYEHPGDCLGAHLGK